MPPEVWKETWKVSSTRGVKFDKLHFLISVALLAFVSVELVSVGLKDLETAATGQDMATMARHAAHRRALIITEEANPLAAKNTDHQWS